MQDTTGKLVKWRLRLPESDFEVVNQVSVKH